MRQTDEMQALLSAKVNSVDFVLGDYPMPPIRLLVNDALKRLKGC
jgi:hypothetical protein